MGFWQTGYFEFHESSGIEKEFAPTPTIFKCDRCPSTFSDFDGLRRHRFEAHALRRPALFLRGHEIGSAPVIVTSSLKAGDVRVDNAVTATISNQNKMPISELGRSLSAIQTGVTTIELHGDYRAAFTLRFQIASNDDVIGVERALLTVARTASLSIPQIEAFIDLCAPFRTAQAYCDGICEYLYGVLRKDGDMGVTRTPASYTERFNAAIDTLSPFERPLSNVICGLIDFHFNHFREVRARVDGTRLSTVANRYLGWLSPGEADVTSWPRQFIFERLESLMSDIHTENILRWANRSHDELVPDIPVMERYLTEVTPYDALKIRVLLAETLLIANESKRAAKHARELINTPDLNSWAERLMAAAIPSP